MLTIFDMERMNASGHFQSLNPLTSLPSFDVDRLFNYSREKILEFSESHQEETFYGFSIDSNLLCLNSEECFKKELEDFTDQFGRQTEAEIQELRENTGNCDFQGFTYFRNEDGFDGQACAVHYDMSAEEQKVSDYGVAMDKLVERLRKSDVFACLKTSPDFYVNRVEHSY